ncbi:sugar phosphate isomerase/epimerase family protein [Neorhodopirellula pilleata]|uniref:Xylose isomerase-like TIM barrel n=1 Tax=Neorhodopirellula pilleata TaxID=2714738 RepID=A0A5C5ZLU8_9BACT|nr:sugar phosphate isomerase/epimerase family protein [Neorhodopirellula pilleata]TWT87811.1 Xylose isomerase-like TIM barrel [Neorhodopirellula pilleata]
MSVTRRSFLAVSSVASVSLVTGGSLANEPILRSGPPRFRIGLAAYSLRPHFRFMKGKPQKSAGDDGLSMFDFLDYCVAQGVEAAELTSYFIEPDQDGFPSDERLRRLRWAAFNRGLTISGTAIGNNFTVGPGPKLDAEIAAAKRWIEKADVLGAPHIRFFAGTAAQLAAAPSRMTEAIDALQQCADLASEKGVFLGVENHGGLDGDQMLELMRRIESPWVGINLDTGNFHTDDPYRDIERCVPYAVNVQVKTSLKRPDGTKHPADLNRVGKILKEAGYQGFVILEYEDENPYEQIPVQLERLREALS